MKSLWVICSGDFLFFLVLYSIAYYSHCGRLMFLALINFSFLICHFFPSDKATTSLSGVLSKNCRTLALSARFSFVVMEIVSINVMLASKFTAKSVV